VGARSVINTSELFDSAAAATGLDDFGEDSFREGLARFVASINTESSLSEFGRSAMRAMIIGLLSNRLQIERWYRRHPEINDERILDPVFITGIPRSGSTALSHMLALDPETRTVRGWEAKEPCPPPELATATSDPRIARYAAESLALEREVPGLRDAVPRDPNAPEECVFLLELSFACVALEVYVHVPSYMEWIMKEGLPELEAAYRYHERVLKLLQWKHPARRWTFRAPAHTVGIEALNKVYPHSRFIWTHRSPNLSMPSVALLMHNVRKAFLQNPPPEVVGSIVVNRWSTGIRRMMAFRERLGDARFLDIAHRDLIKNPVSEVRKIYDYLGWRFDDSMAELVSAWRLANPKGQHKADPAVFGINQLDVNTCYAPYIKRFASLF
jgi:hypothetical protein